MKKFFVALLLLIFSSCGAQAAVNRTGEADVNGDLEISMLNIGHGDAIVIRTAEQTVLIDTGYSVNRARFIRELEKISVTKIDKIILTHPHADHIGGAKMLIRPTEKQLAKYPYLEKISVGAVYDNGVPFTNGDYKNLMKTIAATKIPHQSLKAGDTLNFGGGVNFKVLFPTAEYVKLRNSGNYNKKNRLYRKLNNTSIVGRLTYKNFSMMFTGDAEKEAEALIVKNNRAKDLRCDVLKSGHHGTSTSSKKNFVAAVKPSAVLISASGWNEGEKIARGSPYLAPLETYLAQGVAGKNIFSTNMDGTIILKTDGESFSVRAEAKTDWLDEWMTKKRNSRAKRQKG